MPELFTSFYQQFLETSLLEWGATLSGFLCVYLAARENIWNWPISIISVCIYSYIFFHNKLYGDAVLQVYFLSTAIYGWYYWTSNKQTEAPPIRKLNRSEILGTALVILALTLIIGSALDYLTDSDVPYIDGLCTSISFVAQFLMTRKIVQNWLLWVFVDIVYVPLYLHKDLILTAVLYIAFAIIAWIGYRDWRSTYLQQKHTL